MVAIVLSSAVLAACGGDESTWRTRTRTYQFAIVERALLAIASQDILVTRDNNLKMNWTVDEPGTLIISQFNVEQAMELGVTNTVEFVADTVGTFSMIFKTEDGVETNVLGLKVQITSGRPLDFNFVRSGTGAPR